MNKLPPHAFTWDKYLSRVGYSANQVLSGIEKLHPGMNFIGYCDAGVIPIRPRAGLIAVMIECNGEDFWLHATNDFLLINA